MMYSLLFLASLISLSFSKQMESSIKVGQNFGGWEKQRASHEDTVMGVGFAFKTNPVKRAQLEEIFWEVSDPQHENYGKYLSREEVMEYIAASDESIELVMSWLAKFGDFETVVLPNKDMIRAQIPVNTLSSMLRTEFAEFHNEKFNITVDRVVKPYHLPDAIADVIDLVDGVAMLPGLRSAKVYSSETQLGAGTWDNYCDGATACRGKITPGVTARQYNSYPLNTGFKVAEGNGMAVAEFQGQKFKQADLEKFSTDCGIDQIKVTDFTGKGASTVTSGVETMLDLEYIAGNGLNIPLSDYYYEDYSLLNLAKAINGQSKGAPLVYSVSYGNDEKQQTSTEFMEQCNTAFMTSGTMGYSILFASGDQGVWGRDGLGLKFHPDFPASSPYITTVGGTDFASESPALGAKEKCAADGGGGFSNTFDIPKYQSQAVQDFLTKSTRLPGKEFWNSTGRAYPDISANFGAVVPYCVLAQGHYLGVGGTSASCPTVAHGLAMMNNAQLAAGKPAIGFANPWIYQTYTTSPEAFNDITEGQNNQGKGKGFSAIVGWDACSGVGTPNWQVLAKNLPKQN